MKLTYGDYLSPFPTRVPLGENAFVHLRKPTINEIWQLGFETFDIYQTYLRMTPEFYYTVLCQAIGGVEFWNSIDEEVRKKLTLFEVVLADANMQQIVVSFLNFFYVEKVVFQDSRFFFCKDRDYENKEFNPEDIIAVVADSDRFKQALLWCCLYCDINTEEEKEEQPKFKNKTAEMMWLRIQEAERKQKVIQSRKDQLTYSLPNIISSICAIHNSINYSNVGSLTLPQLKDTLNRLCSLELYTLSKTTVSVWGTKDNDKFSITQWMENNYDRR